MDAGVDLDLAHKQRHVRQVHFGGCAAQPEGVAGRGQGELQRHAGQDEQRLFCEVQQRTPVELNLLAVMRLAFPLVK